MTDTSTSHLRPDGTTFPPVTPDPPYPPGYEAPVVAEPAVADDEQERTEQERTEPADGGRREPPD
jgi:hypothetical protein